VLPEQLVQVQQLAQVQQLTRETKAHSLPAAVSMMDRLLLAE